MTPPPPTPRPRALRQRHLHTMVSMAALQPQRGDAPTQKINKQPYTYSAALVELKRQASGGAVWAKHFVPARKSDDGPACLVCKLCRCSVSATNPSDSMSSHLGSVKCQRVQAEQQTAADVATAAVPEDGAAAAAPAAAGVKEVKQTTFDQLIANSSQRKELLKEAALYFFTSETPFIRVENKHFQRMLSIVGTRAPSEKQLRTTLLNAAYEAAQESVTAKMHLLCVAGAGEQGCQRRRRNRRHDK